MGALQIDLSDYTKLAHHLAWQVDSLAQKLNVEHDDLYQVAMIGLWSASKKYDPSFGTKFSTYAVPVVNGRIYNYLRDSQAQKRTAVIVSLNNTVADSDRTFDEYHADKRVECQFKSVDINLALQEALVRKYFLSDTERKIVKYLLATGETMQKVIGASVGVSQPQARRLLISLRSKLAECVS